MGISYFMIHSCDIIRQTSTRGDAGGWVTTETTRYASKDCLAVPMKPKEIGELAKDAIEADYKFYFDTNPTVDRRDVIRYTGPNGVQRDFDVVAWHQPFDKEDVYYLVYAKTIKDT